MHTRLLLTFAHRRAATSDEARAYAAERLEEDPSFVGEGGRFGSSIADWFVIGGRWSGELTRTLLDPKSPAGELPAGRDDYQFDGADDDAMQVSAVLYDRLLKPYEGRAEVGEESLEFVDLDGDCVSRAAFVGRKWLVVVDYHS